MKYPEAGSSPSYIELILQTFELEFSRRFSSESGRHFFEVSAAIVRR
jgi:hypothetical protein